jgi:hypothetical protein
MFIKSATIRVGLSFPFRKGFDCFLWEFYFADSSPVDKGADVNTGAAYLVG